jgi:hypothetical protein
LPEVVMAHVKKEPGHHNIYVLDRGLQSTRTMKAFSEGQVTFICRAKENRKFELMKSLIAKARTWIWASRPCSEIASSGFIRVCPYPTNEETNTTERSWWSAPFDWLL